MPQLQYVASMTDTTPVQVRSHRHAQWFWLDNGLIDTHARALGPVGVAVYVALCRYASSTTGTCWPSLVRLSQQLGMTHLTARRYLQKLVDRGLIQVTARPGTSALITLLNMPNGSLPDNEVSTEGRYDVTREDGYPGTEGRYDVTRGSLPGNTEPDLLNQTQEPNTPKPPENADALEEGATPRNQETPAHTSDVPVHAPAARTTPQAHGTARFPWERPAGRERPDDFLGSLDAATYASVFAQARQALLDEGVSPFLAIKPAIESRMCALLREVTQQTCPAA